MGSDGHHAEELPRTRVGARVMAAIGFESIAAGSITLRPWEPSDVSFVYDACQDPEIQRWTNLPSPFTASDAIALLHLSSSLREEGKAALFAITSTDQGELLGAVSVREVDHRRRQALIGYWVAVEARRRGAATERGRGAVAVGDGHARPRRGVRRRPSRQRGVGPSARAVRLPRGRGGQLHPARPRAPVDPLRVPALGATSRDITMVRRPSVRATAQRRSYASRT